MSNRTLESADKARISATARPSAGRPTREQAERRHNELLDRALDMFLELGFEMATIEALTASLGMTKRTLYGLYEDKKALFRAAVQRAIERWLVPMETLRAAETDDLEATLTAIARIRMTNAISEAGLRLQRIINAESFRFPEIATLAYDQGAQPTVRLLADLFARYAAKGEIRDEDPELLATAFLTLVVGGPIRSIILGTKAEDPRLEERIGLYVRLFLDGVRLR